MIGKQERNGHPNPDLGAADSQRKLARELISCLGRDGAMHVCKVNGWQGVLQEIVTGGAAQSN
jgi:hypothetical protein